MIIFIRLNAFFAKIYKKKKDNFLYKFTITVSKIFLSQPVVWYGRTIYLSPTEKAVAIKSRDFYKNFHFLFRGILNVKDDYLGSSSGHAAILNTRSSIGSRTCHEN